MSLASDKNGELIKQLRRAADCHGYHIDARTLFREAADALATPASHVDAPLTEGNLRVLAKKHARQACNPINALHPASMQEQIRCEEIIFYALKDAMQWAAPSSELAPFCECIEGVCINAKGGVMRCRRKAQPSSTDARMVLSIVHLLLEDVAGDPSKLVRAQELADRDITPLLAVSARDAQDFKAMDWPKGVPFRMWDDPDEHKPCYLLLPDGAMIAFGYHGRNGVNQAQVKWIMDALNAVSDNPERRKPVPLGGQHASTDGTGAA